MIITKLYGGLGNQMFQYAAGRAMSIHNDSDFFLDVSWFEKIKGNTDRKYELESFNIMERFILEKDRRMLKGQLFSLRSKFGFFKKGYIKEKRFNFEPDILKLSGNVYLDGYWQSEKYFKNVEEIIRGEFTLKKPLNIKSEKLKEQIEKNNSISIHIRRGDYVADPKTNQFHGVCSPEYYYKAVKIITEKINNPVFFIFSDDIEWARENFKLNYPTVYIDKSFGLKDAEEMILMSKCKNHIIANSSFSWWGAWLGLNKNKIVIAPKKWFNNPNVDTSDLIPESWIVI